MCTKYTSLSRPVIEGLQPLTRVCTLQLQSPPGNATPAVTGQQTVALFHANKKASAAQRTQPPSCALYSTAAVICGNSPWLCRESPANKTSAAQATQLGSCAPPRYPAETDRWRPELTKGVAKLLDRAMKAGEHPDRTPEHRCTSQNHAAQLCKCCEPPRTTPDRSSRSGPEQTDTPLLLPLPRAKPSLSVTRVRPSLGVCTLRDSVKPQLT
jgi:hypothetical protein